MEKKTVDLSEPNALRMTLVRRYTYLTLKFSHPIFSESGKWEASWNGGRAEADTDRQLLAAVLERLQDCGSDGHQWETTSEKRDPTNSDYVLLTQRLRCVFCDGRERVLTLYHPSSTVIESTPELRPPKLGPKTRG